MNLYPILLDLTELPVTVIGGGAVACRKVRDLLERGAMVTLVAPEICGEIAALEAEGAPSLRIVRREYRPGDLEGASLAFSATNDGAVNGAVFAEARERRIFLNAVDDPDHCSFIIPSTVTKGDLILCVSTGGASPAMAARIRREIEASLPADIEITLEALKAVRSALQKGGEHAGLDSEERGRILKAIVRNDGLLSEMSRAFAMGSIDDFVAEMRRRIDEGAAES